MLSFIQQREVFDDQACLFYAAEILLALEHLHKLGIIHRDLKPENVLLNEKMHIQISDFGSAVILNDPTPPGFYKRFHKPGRARKNTFVGTAQYVSPEMLTNKKVDKMCDIWALGCIIYQMFTNSPPFCGPNDYLIFLKIQNLDYSYPKNFPALARDLCEQMIREEPSKRLGASDDFDVTHQYSSIRNHPFFESVDNWDFINQLPPPKILSCAKTESGVEEDDYEPGLTEKQYANLLGLQLHDENQTHSRVSKKYIYKLTQEEYTTKMKDQIENNKFHPFVEDNLILRQGLIDKRKGLFARRRMFLLTTGPHLYYVDPANMQLKGEVPFTSQMQCEVKTYRNFYIHTVSFIYLFL